MILILSVSLISFIHELCQSLLWKNYVALNYGKTTQIIHGNVRLHTEGRLTTTRHFFNRYFSKRINPTDEGFLAKPKDEFILMRGAKFH
jgi:hypothetical protein